MEASRDRAYERANVAHIFPAAPVAALATKRVHVISYCNAKNFGDRLGFHVLNQLLPAHAEVTWGTLNPLTAVPRDTDLLVIGIGNSLFGNLLSDGLIQAARNAKAAIGIFGTQYRDDLLRAKLDRLLPNLTHWYARYQDEALLYGGGSAKVSHLGDWLVNAFPMARGTEERMLNITNDLLNLEVPLDRFIQFTQLHRRVMSSRLHPLLCALTSAEEVGYHEQREMPGSDKESGKFRSMLLDIFDRQFPEGVMWRVDRQRVLAYKVKVEASIAHLRNHLGQLLS